MAELPDRQQMTAELRAVGLLGDISYGRPNELGDHTIEDAWLHLVAIEDATFTLEHYPDVAYAMALVMEMLRAEMPEALSTEAEVALDHVPTLVRLAFLHGLVAGRAGK